MCDMTWFTNHCYDHNRVDLKHRACEIPDDILFYTKFP